jgi:hypothetical protein
MKNLLQEDLTLWQYGRQEAGLECHYGCASVTLLMWNLRFPSVLTKLKSRGDIKPNTASTYGCKWETADALNRG